MECDSVSPFPLRAFFHSRNHNLLRCIPFPKSHWRFKSSLDIDRGRVFALLARHLNMITTIDPPNQHFLIEQRPITPCSPPIKNIISTCIIIIESFELRDGSIRAFIQKLRTCPKQRFPPLFSSSAGHPESADSEWPLLLTAS